MTPGGDERGDEDEAAEDLLDERPARLHHRDDQVGQTRVKVDMVIISVW